jgi:hypothetical protein
MGIGRSTVGLAAVIALASTTLTSTALADEPNETFFTATILPPGVLLVEDEFGGSGGANPDTIVGSRGFFGDIEFYDDEGSPYGDGHASALYGIPTNSGSIDFAVTGFPDEFFFGGHSESGKYEAYVTVFDFFGDEVDSFTVPGMLTPGAVDDFSFNDFEWLNGYYNVEINNSLQIGDVDFFTYTGLTPGVEFTAETLDPTDISIDTVLGWYDESGNQLVFDDDHDLDESYGGTLSLISGIVPASGTLTFGVSGYYDPDFIGDHGQFGRYDLQLTLPDEGLAGDFNGDLVVNAADYTVWRDQGMTPAKYAEWADNYGATAASSAVPEPSSAMIALGLAALVASGIRR